MAFFTLIIIGAAAGFLATRLMRLNTDVPTTVAIGIFGAVVTGLLTAFPKELVVAIAGLALLGTIGNGLATALRDEPHREAALITFLVTLSGVVIGGVGSAFWGVVAGSVALFVQQYARRNAPRKH